MVGLFVAIALTVGILPLRDPLQVSSDRLAAPSPAFPFGTDALGRDVFSMLMVGAQNSILVGRGFTSDPAILKAALDGRSYPTTATLGPGDLMA